MTKRKTNNNCVYFHVNKTKQEVFYVGIGCLNRAFHKKGRNRFWQNIARKYDYDIIIIHKNLSWGAVCELEKQYIRQIGRRIKKEGSLTNIHPGGNGGDGHEHSEETKLKMSLSKKGTRLGKENSWYGKHPTEEVRKLLSEKAKEQHKNGISKNPPVMIGENNPAAKCRILISPKGEEFITYSLRKFCEENNLCMKKLRLNTNKGPIQSVTTDLYKQRYKSLNTVGWECRE